MIADPDRHGLLAVSKDIGPNKPMLIAYVSSVALPDCIHQWFLASGKDFFVVKHIACYAVQSKMLSLPVEWCWH
jgi:hypothetical protein